MRMAEHNRKISEALKGRKFSDEHRENIARAKRGKHIDVSNRPKKFGPANPFFGKTHSEDTLRKIGESTMARRWKRLEKYGVSKEQYDSMLANGFKWCSIHKGFTESGKFKTRQTACERCARNILLLRKYQVTVDWYEQKLAQQNGVCAICRKPPFGRKKYLDVDHDHSNGLARSLLCGKCNTAIERADTVQDWLGEATRYLEKHGSAKMGG